MEIKKSRKGVSTIEMIVSFTIFLAFVIFLIAYLNPVRTTDISGALLDSAEAGIDNATQTSLVEMPVALPEGGTSGCFEIPNPFNLTGASISNMFIEDSQGRYANFAIVHNYNLTIQGTSSSEKIYYIYFSEDETTNDAHTLSCSSPFIKYSFSVPRLKVYYSYSKLKAFNKTYFNDTIYNSMKTQFNLPGTYNFGLRIYNSTSTIMEIMRQKPEKVIVKAREIPIQLMHGKTTEYAQMSVQVW